MIEEIMDQYLSDRFKEYRHGKNSVLGSLHYGFIVISKDPQHRINFYFYPNAIAISIPTPHKTIIVRSVTKFEYADPEFFDNIRRFIIEAGGEEC